jgi:chromosome segregation ATPase
MTELERFDHRICEIHKKYDELQAEARSKEERLREMRDQLADLKREAEMVKSNLQDSPQAKVGILLVFKIKYLFLMTNI